MFADFRKAFNQTDEEKIKLNRFLNTVEKENMEFWFKKGLTSNQYNKLKNLEIKEESLIHRMCYYVSRRDLLENQIITMEEVLKDIEV